MIEPAYRLTATQVRSFRADGYLGPLACADPNLLALPAIAHRAGLRSRGSDAPIPDPATWMVTDAAHINVHDPHREVPEIMAIAAHPSVVQPVAQLLGCATVAFFQSRFRVKFPRKADPVPWHQDVGENNGGLRADGTPIPTITVWLSVDGATGASGAIEVLPGTHTRLWGDWRSGFHSDLEGHGELRAVDRARAVTLPARPGEFYLFHSWTLHRSSDNDTAALRSALVLRFAAPEDAIQPGTEYHSFPAALGVNRTSSQPQRISKPS